MVPSSYLHRGADRLRQRYNSIPNIQRFPPNNYVPYYPRNRNNAIPRQVVDEEEPETVFVNLKVDSEEVPETKYVNLYISARRNVNK